MSIIVPQDQLRPETLLALIEEFLTRDGAVHGHVDVPIETRIGSARRLLASGRAVIVFDEEAGNCTIVMKDQLPKDLDQRPD